MRIVHTLGAVITCGIIAGLSGVFQGAPSRAASYAPLGIGSEIPTPPPFGGGLIQIRKSSSVETHFAAANTSHDGHLTRQQALDGDWPKVSKHFDEIDTDHKGWISVEQIHQYNKSHHKHRKEKAV